LSLLVAGKVFARHRAHIVVLEQAVGVSGGHLSHKFAVDFPPVSRRARKVFSCRPLLNRNRWRCLARQLSRTSCIVGSNR
jgi:hypothetical protein